MNQEQFQGKWAEFKGALKQQWGKFTDSDIQEIEGDVEKFKGKIQQIYGEQKQEVSDWTDKWFKQAG